MMTDNPLSFTVDRLEDELRTAREEIGRKDEDFRVLVRKYVALARAHGWDDTTIETSLRAQLSARGPGALVAPAIPDGCEMEEGYLSGQLRLAGHRISMAQIIATLAECDASKLFACEYDLDEAEVSRALHGIAMWLELFNAKNQPAPAPTAPVTVDIPQDISTAPKDVAILVYASGWTKAHFNTAYGGWIGYGADTSDTKLLNSFNAPTHWLPLPPDPTAPPPKPEKES